MSLVSIGDLAQALQLRQDNLRLRSDIQRLSAELSTGRRADVSAPVSGDFGALPAIEASLQRIGSYDLATDEAALLAGATQQALETVQTSMTGLTPTLLLAQDGSQAQIVAVAGADARVRFAAVAAALNTTTADRSLFAGAAVDGPALADAETMLDDLVLATAAETTAAGVELVVRTWFDPGGGFDTIGYLGDATPASPVAVRDGETVALDARADDPALRSAMAGFAMAALIDRGVLPGDPAGQAALARRAGETLLTAERGIVDLRAATGRREEAIDRAATRNAAERASLELARNTLTAADPFESATALRAAEAQLEALYTLTARLSRLSLTEFLR